MIEWKKILEKLENIDKKLDKIEKRMDDLESRMDELYQKVVDLDWRVTVLEDKYKKKNMWIYAKPFGNVRKSKHNICTGGVWGARRDKSGTFGRL